MRLLESDAVTSCDTGPNLIYAVMSVATVSNVTVVDRHASMNTTSKVCKTEALDCTEIGSYVFTRRLYTESYTLASSILMPLSV